MSVTGRSCEHFEPLMDPSRQFIFVPGRMPDPGYAALSAEMTPHLDRFLAKNRKRVNDLSTEIITESYVDGFNLPQHSDLFWETLNQLSASANYSSFDIITAAFMDALEIDRTLPVDRKIAELIAKNVKLNLFQSLDVTLVGLQSRRDPRYSELAGLLRQQNTEVQLDAIDAIPDVIEGHRPKMTPADYIGAGIHEGVSFVMATLQTIPEALHEYNRIKGLAQPTQNDIYNFAKKHGLLWVSMHAEAYKESLFPLLHSTGLMQQDPDDGFEHAPVFKPGSIVIREHPLTHDPALAYNAAVMDQVQLVHIALMFSEITAAPLTRCPAYNAGVTSQLYSHMLEIMHKASVLGY